MYIKKLFIFFLFIFLFITLYIFLEQKQKKLKFIHITKCAGTFIETVGKDNNIKWGQFHNEYRCWTLPYNSPWHHPFSILNKNLKKKYDWFVIVRNPYDRILSEYYCIWGGIKRKTNKHNKLKFNKYLIDKIKNRGIKNYHYYEQYKYLDNYSKIHIVKFEKLNEELPLLFSKYNLDIKLDNYNKINYFDKKKYSIYDFDKELINLINKVYSKDFELFNYTKMY